SPPSLDSSKSSPGWSMSPMGARVPAAAGGQPAAACHPPHPRLCRRATGGKHVGMTDNERETEGPAARREGGEIVEPPNSTVDDWLGQQASRDEEVVDELLEETGGDEQEAERRFAERSHQDRPDRLPTEERRT